MARKRMVDPDIWTDAGFMDLSWGARLLFLGLISRADDEGRGNGSAKSLKAAVFPSDEITVGRIEKLKEECELYTRTKFYEANGQTYYQLAKWRSYQQIQHPTKSSIPPFIEASLNATGKLNEHSPQLVSQLVNKLDSADSVSGTGKSHGPSLMRPSDLDEFSPKNKMLKLIQGINTEEAR